LKENLRKFPSLQSEFETMSKTKSELGFDINDILMATKYAALSITDDKEGTLQKVVQTGGPWHVKNLALITGSEEEAFKPLTYLLDRYMGLQIDCFMDKTCVTPGLDFVDLQGYIAHNDETIVVAYRCTSSNFDWIANFSGTSSEWELEEDLAQGYAGMCSGLEGLLCLCLGSKPRVHTGFYSNLLASIPYLKEHVEPLLGKDKPPRKLYICGHSLGAGIATLAGIYFLLEHDWSQLPQKLVLVTLGGPRACQKGMQELVDKEVKRLKADGHGDKVSLYRVVKDQDIVATLPPTILGYRHLDEYVFINDDGVMKLVGNGEERNTEDSKVQSLTRSIPKISAEDNDDEKSEDEKQKEYQAKVQGLPKMFRDHILEFYMKPMMKLASSY
jgi:Lipase (class 3)